MTKQQLIETIKEKIEKIDSKENEFKEIHKIVADSVMQYIKPYWKDCIRKKQEKKRAFYFSAEFLVGRAILNNLLCLSIYKEIEDILEEKGFNISVLEEEQDIAIGNGGLGRLAACFLDSAASLNIPLDGYGIKYQFGYFKQTIEDGFQNEEPENWEDSADSWLCLCKKDAVEVCFKDEIVVAVPYDMPIIGYENGNFNVLRLWQAKAKDGFSLKDFNSSLFQKAFEKENEAKSITAVLYPNDETKQGKKLRLKQQYFFCSASLQDILKKYKKKYGSNFEFLDNSIAIQLNDTHPVIAIVELIRILCDCEGIEFKEAFKIAKNVFSYTNHTIMPEALEKWQKDLVLELLPDIYKYILKIEEEFCFEMDRLKVKKELVQKIDIIKSDFISMADMAVFCCKKTNGVSKIHTEILKNSCLKEWHEIYRDRFLNITNGITQRRWLLLCNKELSFFISKLLGGYDFVKNLEMLKELEKFSNEKSVLEEFRRIKQKKKEQLARYIEKKEGVVIDPNTIFDVQTKRLHEYKRQLLNILAILSLYFRIKRGEIKDFFPTTFIFGAKAAPSYRRAKAIIKLINTVSSLVLSDSICSKYIKIVFVQNYNVSYAEKIVPACNVSEQISTAGTEACGTGNMKFMLNGAVTLGTYDGANIEIVGEAKRENNYIFGKTVEEIKDIEEEYNPVRIYNENKYIKEVIDLLDSKLLGEESLFLELKDSILKGASWHKPDQYYLLLDFDEFFKAKLFVNKDYKDQYKFDGKCWANIYSAGKFSSDRAIKEYATKIWGFNP